MRVKRIRAKYKSLYRLLRVKRARIILRNQRSWFARNLRSLGILRAIINSGVCSLMGHLVSETLKVQVAQSDTVSQKFANLPG